MFVINKIFTRYKLQYIILPLVVYCIRDNLQGNQYLLLVLLPGLSSESPGTASQSEFKFGIASALEIIKRNMNILAPPNLLYA